MGTPGDDERCAAAAVQDRGSRLACELLEDGITVTVQVTGFSMSPFIRSGDVVTLDPCDGSRARVGDVVGFRTGGGKLVIHRVVAETGAVAVTRGDAAPCADGRVERSTVVGRVRSVERGTRRVRLGFGPEQVMVAWLSRRGWLIPLLLPVRAAVRLARRANGPR